MFIKHLYQAQESEDEREKNPCNRKVYCLVGEIRKYPNYTETNQNINMVLRGYC